MLEPTADLLFFLFPFHSKQLEDLRRSALIIQESMNSPVGEPCLSVDLFHLKVTVMKVLLMCRRGLTVSANLAIRGGSEGSVLVSELITSSFYLKV